MNFNFFCIKPNVYIISTKLESTLIRIYVYIQMYGIRIYIQMYDIYIDIYTRMFYLFPFSFYFKESKS